MHSQIKRELDMLEGVDQFGHKDGITLNAKAASLLAQIVIKKSELKGLASSQVSGGADFHAGTDERAQVAGNMLELMRGIAKIARELPSESYPGISEQFRMPNPRSYAAVVATASSFLEKVGPNQGYLRGGRTPGGLRRAARAAHRRFRDGEHAEARRTHRTRRQHRRPDGESTPGSQAGSPARLDPKLAITGMTR